MGQYYRAVFLKKDKKTVEASVSPWEPFHDGAKLMEHSYIDNFFVNSVEKLLLNTPSRLVWAGDYADGEEGLEDENGYEINLHDIANDKKNGVKFPYEAKGRYIPTFNEIWDCTPEQSREWFPEWNEIKELSQEKDIYVLNHDKKQYYVRPKRGEEQLVINPLPLLTAEGNGRGGGDYYGTNIDDIGMWSRDTIEYTTELPSGFDYELIKPDFTEE